MTWSISASGKKAAVLETVNAATCSCEEGSKEQAAFERAKAHAIEVVEDAADDAEASVSCSGHGTKTDGVQTASSESLSISTWAPNPDALK